MVGQLIRAVASVPPWNTAWGGLHLPDCQTEVEPSDRVTTQWDAVAHDTE